MDTVTTVEEEMRRDVTAAVRAIDAAKARRDEIVAHYVGLGCSKVAISRALDVRWRGGVYEAARRHNVNPVSPPAIDRVFAHLYARGAVDPDGSVSVDTTGRDIADAIGSATITVDRTVPRLRAMGLVSVTRNGGRPATYTIPSSVVAAIAGRIPESVSQVLDWVAAVS